MNKDDSGLIKRALIHTDHTLIVDIDTHGSIRTARVVDIEFSPINNLIEDVAQGLHYLNGEAPRPIVIDAYTSNSNFAKFIQSIITEMFKQATTRRVEEKFRFIATTFENRTTLHADRLHLSIGPYIKSDFEDIVNPYKGIILDIKEAEDNKLNIEDTLKTYDWAAIIVQKEKKEGYYHALSSLFDEMSTPFFIEILNNQSLQELFDFIFALTLALPQ